MTKRTLVETQLTGLDQQEHINEVRERNNLPPVQLSDPDPFNVSSYTPPSESERLSEPTPSRNTLES